MLLLLPGEATAPPIDLDDPWTVSPGIEGFVMFAILGVILWFLIKSMTGHIRKANFRAAEREEELYGSAPPAGGSTRPRAPVREEPREAGTRSPEAGTRSPEAGAEPDER
nr:hypothetical protein [Actinomycetales bacterium]